MKILDDIKEFFTNEKEFKQFWIDRDIIIKKQLLLKEKEHAILLQNMKMKYCPIMKSNCTSKCIHFYAGYARINEFMEDRYVSMVKPKCKLWRND